MLLCLSNAHVYCIPPPNPGIKFTNPVGKKKDHRFKGQFTRHLDSVDLTGTIKFDIWRCTFDWVESQGGRRSHQKITGQPFFLNNSLGNSRMEPVTSKLAGPAQDNPVTGIRVIDNLPGREVRLPDIRFHPKETVKFSSLYHNFFVLFQRRIYEIYRNYRKFVRAVPEPYQKTVQSLYLYLH